MAASSFSLFSRTFLSGLFSATHLAREGDRGLPQLAFGDELVDEAHVQALLRGHVLAAGHHLQRLLDADDARQPLRAAGAGQQAEVHFRQAAFALGTATR